MKRPISYADLGVRPFINGRGNGTASGGSLMPAPVLEAMRQAAGNFVALETLQERIGERLARRIGVEGALVTCGAASGVQQAAAACLTGTDAERVQRLPYTDGWRNRFVIPQVDAHDYLFQLIAAAGGVLVKVGSTESCPTAAVEAALDDDTAAVVHYLGKQTLAQLAEVVAVAEPRGIPVIVDAAAQLPPRSNLTEPARLGAGLVVFSRRQGAAGAAVKRVGGRQGGVDPRGAHERISGQLGRPRHEGGQGGADGPARRRGAVPGRQRRG